uniref:Amino acid transporter transmembrane domain-containing protein n=1 Tax=Schizaphis graminum TaxID=13262 RepID=A0A2S2PDX9_SCHGA
MVALSILFSYGLQFCVPSEIVWTRLEPWLRKRRQNNMYSADNKITTSCGAAVTTIAGNTMSTATAVTTTSATMDEKKKLEIESNQQDKPMDGAYYVMRASMILGTVLIAALVPDLAPFISLIGAVFFSILGLMCPAVIHLATFWNHGNEDGEDMDDVSDSEDDLDFDGDYYAVDDDTDLEAVQRQPQRRRSSGRSTRRRKGMSCWTVAKDVAIVLIALIALVSGTYASLVDIVAFYGSSGEGGHHAANGNGTAAAHGTTTIGPGPESAFLVAVNGGH